MARLPARPPHGLELTDAERASIGPQYRAGVPVAEIARGLRCHANTVYYHLRAQGVPLTRRAPSHADARREARTRAILAQYQAGLEVRDIAARHGMAVHAVRKLLLNRGLRADRTIPPPSDPDTR